MFIYSGVTQFFIVVWIIGSIGLGISLFGFTQSIQDRIPNNKQILATTCNITEAIEKAASQLPGNKVEEAKTNIKIKYTNYGNAPRRNKKIRNVKT